MVVGNVCQSNWIALRDVIFPPGLVWFSYPAFNAVMLQRCRGVRIRAKGFATLVSDCIVPGYIVVTVMGCLAADVKGG